MQKYKKNARKLIEKQKNQELPILAKTKQNKRQFTRITDNRRYGEQYKATFIKKCLKRG